ncbi:MAG: hypothetical protein CMF22_11235 [Idiomarinaceae bacterium]|nr:hypothetical protein [Idiomarinaceae bacterium]|tara:strand:+ start:141075 stop:141872 length:798 start_codon:yes stop_codon:yes gene_type:complete
MKLSEAYDFRPDHPQLNEVKKGALVSSIPAPFVAVAVATGAISMPVALGINLSALAGGLIYDYFKKDARFMREYEIIQKDAHRRDVITSVMKSLPTEQKSAYADGVRKELANLRMKIRDSAKFLKSFITNPPSKIGDIPQHEVAEMLKLIDTIMEGNYPVKVHESKEEMITEWLIYASLIKKLYVKIVKDTEAKRAISELKDLERRGKTQGKKFRMACIQLISATVGMYVRGSISEGDYRLYVTNAIHALETRTTTSITGDYSPL